jgi:hypothetical protein
MYRPAASTGTGAENVERIVRDAISIDAPVASARTSITASQ